MSLFLLNILLSLLWCFTWGTFDFYTLLAGFVLGYVLLGIFSRVTSVEGYGNKVFHLISFAIYFLRILVKANLELAYEVLTPTHHQRPRIIRYSVEGMNDVQITTFANALTLTPGTLVVDISPDKRFLFVHCMYARDREEAVRGLDELRQRLAQEVF